MKKEETMTMEACDENEELAEVYKPSFKEKVSLGVKKYRKKVATAAAIGAAFTLGIILGGTKTSNDSESYDSDDIIDGEYTEVDSEE